MSIQNQIGITSNCLSDKPSGIIMTSKSTQIKNDISSSVSYSCMSVGTLDPDENQSDHISSTSEPCVITNANTSSIRRVTLNSTKVLNQIKVSWLPICTTVQMCNASQTYISGGSSLRIMYFGDQFTIYKLGPSGLNSVSKFLITDQDLGKFWQFDVTTNDFVVIVNGITQYQLKFIESGFYYFQDMMECGNKVYSGNVVSGLKETLLDVSQTFQQNSLSTKHNNEFEIVTLSTVLEMNGMSQVSTNEVVTNTIQIQKMSIAPFSGFGVNLVFVNLYLIFRVIISFFILTYIVRRLWHLKQMRVDVRNKNSAVQFSFNSSS